MTGIEAVNAPGAITGAHAATAAAPDAERATGQGFAQMLSQGVAQMEAKVDRANELVRAFALDDSIPVHEVTIALEEARLAVEFAMQVRARIVEAYREIMTMQL